MNDINYWANYLRKNSPKPIQKTAMELFTKEIEAKLQEQFKLDNQLEKQNVICKIFNPYGAGTWYIINQDPEDPDYLWAIVEMGYGWEIGSVSKSDLEDTKIKMFGEEFPFERDLYFIEKNASELFDFLVTNEGEIY